MPYWDYLPLCLEERLLTYLPPNGDWDKLSVYSDSFCKQRFKASKLEIFNALGHLRSAGLCEKKSMPHPMGMRGTVIRKYATAYRLTESGQERAREIRKTHWKTFGIPQPA